MKKYHGNLEIEEGDTIDYSELEEVTGDLCIYSNADLKALKSVGGYLYISSNADLKAPQLKSVGGYLSIYSNADLKALKSVGGYLFISSNADLKAPQLKSVGGYLCIYSKISIDTAKNLWGNNRKKNTRWIICNLVPEWLIKMVSQRDNSEYYINNVRFPLEWFNKIRKDELSAEEVFAIDNQEHRRVAYEYMDKSKLKQLKDFETLDEQKDDKGKTMKIVSFKVQNMDEPLLFYNCVDASSDREYFVQTDEKTCWRAKNKSFGFAEDVEWVNEW